ncbi:pre-mRNA-splicing factor cwc15 [Emergomyces africanus]|uniref:Pre-mRNA-splicing factor cwc15 n=1 Tax=Emergomyces africanus TaxID=1955775 RepID=A0A1B7P7H2_9EURO|nr:pre-mRNA-splicing factor cwc15 [Emergomyces africanus]
MTTAHRPTFDPARGKEALRGPAYHQRLLPAHTLLKTRKPGQGGDADAKRDLRAELLKAEAAHFAKKGISHDKSGASPSATAAVEPSIPKRLLENGAVGDENGEIDDPEAKRRRILEETRDIDADSDGSESDSSEEESDDDEDETAELMRELEKIKRERAEQKAKEEQEREALEQEKREVDIARGNPLLNPQDFNVKRRWDDDVVFKNQARGTENRGKKEFVNDLLRSDFHKRFMVLYSSSLTKLLMVR